MVTMARCNAHGLENRFDGSDMEAPVSRRASAPRPRSSPALPSRPSCADGSSGRFSVSACSAPCTPPRPVWRRAGCPWSNRTYRDHQRRGAGDLRRVSCALQAEPQPAGRGPLPTITDEHLGPSGDHTLSRPASAVARSPPRAHFADGLVPQASGSNDRFHGEALVSVDGLGDAPSVAEGLVSPAHSQVKALVPRPSGVEGFGSLPYLRRASHPNSAADV
jgi:hypothetical protein